MNRWKVHRTSDEISPWAAIFNGWEDGNLVLRESYHGTWTEAIAHADHMARTIEVTLPRYPLPLELQGEEGDTTIVVEQQPKENSVSIKDDFQDDTILLRRFELQPLALALLAEAQYGEEACPR